ncbi:MAG: hypothetical protein ACRERE_41270 [Candidatus Entotheonellia bacterium]
MKHLRVFVQMILLMLLPALVVANAGTLTTFDVPGAISTEPQAINPAGVITGFYFDAVSSIPHGFLRASDGTFTTFDVPGARQQTVPRGINPAGAITGNYSEGRGIRGFLRAPTAPSPRSMP